MSGDELCSLTELPRYSCAHCKGLGELPGQREPFPSGGGRSFASRHQGLCQNCREDILIGDSIMAAEPYGYTHTECAAS